MSERLIRIAAFTHVIDAYLLKTRLESAGIDCFIADDNTILVNWLYSTAIGGVKVKVRSSDAEHALEILREAPVEVVASGDMADEEAEFLCPRCNSEDTFVPGFSRTFAYVSWLFLGFPIPYLNRKWHCFACSHRWKA